MEFSLKRYQFRQKYNFSTIKKAKSIKFTLNRSKFKSKDELHKVYIIYDSLKQ